MKEWGYGEGYRYAHDEGGLAGRRDVPARRARGERFYEPKASGYEAKLREHLERLRKAKARDGE